MAVAAGTVCGGGADGRPAVSERDASGCGREAGVCGPAGQGAGRGTGTRGDSVGGDECAGGGEEASWVAEQGDAGRAAECVPGDGGRLLRPAEGGGWGVGAAA